MVGKFILILGPMFAGKTSTLINFARKYSVAKKKVSLIKYKGDDRYSVSNIVSHNEDWIEATYTTDNLSNEEKNITLPSTLFESDVIIIDEIQFFSGALNFIRIMTDNGKIVICAGLNGDFNRKIFPVISELIPDADEIIHMKSICEVCHNENAIFSKLIDRSDTNSTVIIGGSEKYQARCRKCFNE